MIVGVNERFKADYGKGIYSDSSFSDAIAKGVWRRFEDWGLAFRDDYEGSERWGMF